MHRRMTVQRARETSSAFGEQYLPWFAMITWPPSKSEIPPKALASILRFMAAWVRIERRKFARDME